MKVPFLELKRQYESIKEEINDAIQTVLESQQFILGQEVEEFEIRMAKYFGVTYAIGVASGTDALLLSLKACGISSGVITTPFTFFATAGAIHNAGAIPIFTDIEPDTYNIDAEEIKKLFGSKEDKKIRIKAIIPVHLFGQAADMDAIMEIAEKYDLIVIEDAAQAIGEEYYGKKVGSMTIGCFSFFPSKNLGGYGDGGLITTNDEDLADKIRTLRMHGAKPKYYHHVIGYNSRLDTIQAAILNVKLNHLEEWTDKRRDNAGFYSKALDDIDELETPQITEGRRHIFNQYTIRVKNGKRNKLKEFLERQGVGTAIYYPLPLHLQPCFSFLGYNKGDFPAAEKASEEVLSLPIFPELSEDEREYVVDKIEEFFGIKR
jgi:dTDP-4-amino-4,6-dideoxygalactose transaminase